MKELRILFTGAGRRVELIRAFREAAFVREYPLVIYGCDMSDRAVVLAYCDRVRGIIAMKDPSYIDALLEICKRDKIDLVIPTIDTDLLVLSKNRERFLSVGTRVLISSPDMIALCRDKNKTGDFFRSCGLKAPDTVHDIADYRGAFPAFIKPKDGSSSINAHIVKDEASLLHYAKEVPDYVIQPCIRGREYTIDICCDLEGRTLSIVPRERLAVRAGEGLHTRITTDERMIKEAQAIIDAFHPCGPLTVQLIREEETGEDYFIEINPRFGGGAPLSMKAGSDAAGALLDCIAGERKEGAKEVRLADGAVYHRFDDSVQVSPGTSPLPLAGVIFDLDDTLYPETDYVKSGYAEVAAHLGDPAYADRLWAYFEKKEPAIDRLLEELGRQDEAENCLRIYRTHTPSITLAQEVRVLLSDLHAQGVRLGILTDGRTEGQQAKIRALGLESLVDDILITDALGGVQFRKPCDIGFRILQRKWRLPFARIGYVGDNVRKDFIAPLSLGMRALYVPCPAGLYYDGNETEIFHGITTLSSVTEVKRHCEGDVSEEEDQAQGAGHTRHGAGDGS